MFGQLIHTDLRGASVAKKAKSIQSLGAREREILEIVYRLQKASVADVRGAIPAAPSYSAVRTMLGQLEKKGFLSRQLEGIRYEYQPVKPLSTESRSAFRHMVSTFFGGSPSAAIAAFVNESAGKLSAEELDELQALIEKVRNKETE